MAVLSDAELLRLYLGEVIPAGGSDQNTMFSTNDIETFLSQGGTVTGAAALGWMAKAGNLARLVDVSEGPSKRYLQQRHANALAMIEHYRTQAPGRTRIGRISRAGGL